MLVSKQWEVGNRTLRTYGTARLRYSVNSREGQQTNGVAAESSAQGGLLGQREAVALHTGRGSKYAIYRQGEIIRTHWWDAVQNRLFDEAEAAASSLLLLTPTSRYTCRSKELLSGSARKCALLRRAAVARKGGGRVASLHNAVWKVLVSSLFHQLAMSVVVLDRLTIGK